MNTSTWGRNVQVVHPESRPAAGSQRHDWDEGDSQLEQWHESHLGNACYLALFMQWPFSPLWPSCRCGLCSRRSAPPRSNGPVRGRTYK